MTTPRQTQNRAKHWNARIAAATTDQERAGVWYDACRTLARQAERDGGPDLWRALTAHLHDFYKRNGG
ncbi:hypothetical protein [Streptomyces aureoverticillatus]|uniref:hypothetical protein n=1 Tax=Streptomyces aureoverticillatus TaxID=66871 RepID=UPI0013DC494F|nr:hypothetical protein [Streptomyces aureoverticillatus]QIB49498.1 hypothetical protein G3H79_40725 [Streptomyces aureoverticillatus]